MRVTVAPARKQRKKAILEQAKGFYGRRKSCFGLAIDAVKRKSKNAFIGRKHRKRQMRSLWIQRINAGARLLGYSYSKLMDIFNKTNFPLNRKMVSELFARNFDEFKVFVQPYIDEGLKLISQSKV